MRPTHKVLAAMAGREAFDALRPLLHRSHVECNRVANGEACLILAATAPYDLILVQLPLIDMSASMFISTLRGSGSPCQNARLLFLASGNHGITASVFREADTDSIALATSIEEFRAVVAEALGLSVRAASRILINVHVETSDEASSRVYQTENLSRSGMLLKTDHPLPIGTEFFFDFDLPEAGQAFQGTGEVVRHTIPDREKIYGMGIHFSDFTAGSERELELFVRHQLAASS